MSQPQPLKSRDTSIIQEIQQLITGYKPVCLVLLLQHPASSARSQAPRSHHPQRTQYLAAPTGEVSVSKTRTMPESGEVAETKYIFVIMGWLLQLLTSKSFLSSCRDLVPRAALQGWGAAGGDDHKSTQPKRELSSEVKNNSVMENLQCI